MVMELTGSIRYISILGSGSTTASGGKASCTKVNKYSSKACLRRD